LIKEREIAVVDDSGLLGLVDPDVQMYDPNDEASPAKGLPHFIFELEPGDREPWKSVA
jgi:hypothetical protein